LGSRGAVGPCTPRLTSGGDSFVTGRTLLGRSGLGTLGEPTALMIAAFVDSCPSLTPVSPFWGTFLIEVTPTPKPYLAEKVFSR